MLKKIIDVFRLSIIYSLFCCAFLSNASADSHEADNKPVNVLVWGDSLSAAYDIPTEKGWVQLLQNKFADKIEVTNASISGETTQGGLSRLATALELHAPDIVLLELGANDGLRGISLKVMQANLDKMIIMAKEQAAIVILLGIKIPPNYGVSYTKQFDQVYSDLAEKHELGFVPFILKDIATSYELMQEDGLHPNEEAQPILLGNILGVVEKALDKVTENQKQ